MILFNFTFYIFICVTFLVLLSNQKKPGAKLGIILYALLTVIWLWAVLSFREPSGDPWRYMLGLNHIATLNFYELINYEKDAFGFALLNWLTSLISTDSALFFSIIYFFCVIPLYFAFRENFNKTDAAVLIMLYLLYPFYINYLASGFKQGIAFGFMLWGLNCIFDRANSKWIKGLLLLFIATLFHKSFWIANIALAGWYFIYRKKPLSWSIVTLGICILIAITGIAEPLMSAILPENMINTLGFSTYFDQDFLSSNEYLSVGYKSGFRIDFTIFTLLPIFIIYILDKKTKNNNKQYDILKYYCLISSSYFLMVFIPYSDRIAGFSWFLIPFMFYKYFDSHILIKYRNIFVITMLFSYPILMLSYIKVFFQ